MRRLGERERERVKRFGLWMVLSAFSTFSDLEGCCRWIVGWSVGWLVGWLVGCLVAWLLGWLVGILDLQR